MRRLIDRVDRVVGLTIFFLACIVVVGLGYIYDLCHTEDES